MGGETRQPFLPLFVGDFFGATALWEGEEKALYMLLLAHQWASGPLPKDAARIAKVIGYEPKRFLKLWQQVGAKFVEVDGGLINRRAEEHRSRAAAFSAERSESGKRGAEARHQRVGSVGSSATSSATNGASGSASSSASGSATQGASGSSLASNPEPEKNPTQPFPPSGKGRSSRSHGTNPRATGTNPRARGTNARAIHQRSLEAWRRATALIDEVNGTGPSLTWQHVTEQLADPIAQQAIERAGGHRLLADRDRFNQRELQTRFRDHYERLAEEQR